MTTLRESISSGVYFSSYYGLKDSNIPIFISGGLAGCLSWLTTYPIDTIKTKYQINHKINISTILRTQPLWNGISFCLLRAFLVNSTSFLIYEKIN